MVRFRPLALTPKIVHALRALPRSAFDSIASFLTIHAANLGYWDAAR